MGLLLAAPESNRGNGTESEAGNDGPDPAHEGEAGDDNAGNQDAEKDGEKGFFESDTHEDRGDGACPGAGNGQGDGDEEDEADSLIFFDNAGFLPRNGEEPVEELFAKGNFAEESGQPFEEEENERDGEHIADDGDDIGVIPREMAVEDSNGDSASQFGNGENGKAEDFQNVRNIHAEKLFHMNLPMIYISEV